jgi:Universal stress protein family
MASPKSPRRPESRDTFDTHGPGLGFGQKWNDAGKGKRPSIAGIQGGSSDGRRKSSIAFNTAPAEETIRRESTTRVPTLSSITETRRMSSPPPPQTYQRGVSFDTFDNKDATDLSFTLTYKHKDYKNTRRSRTFLCGTDQKDYSEFALEWLIDELVDDGDEIVCLRVVEKDSSIASTSSIEAGRYRKEAQDLLDSVIKKNSQEEKTISLVMELAVGRVQDIIQRMVNPPSQTYMIPSLHSPDSNL